MIFGHGNSGLAIEIGDEGWGRWSWSRVFMIRVVAVPGIIATERKVNADGGEEKGRLRRPSFPIAISLRVWLP